MGLTWCAGELRGSAIRALDLRHNRLHARRFTAPYIGFLNVFMSNTSILYNVAGPYRPNDGRIGGVMDRHPGGGAQAHGRQQVDPITAEHPCLQTPTSVQNMGMEIR